MSNFNNDLSCANELDQLANDIGSEIKKNEQVVDKLNTIKIGSSKTYIKNEEESINILKQCKQNLNQIANSIRSKVNEIKAAEEREKQEQYKKNLKK